MQTPLKLAAVSVIAALGFAAHAPAQVELQTPGPLADPFAFFIPNDDQPNGSATDVSFLNHTPAGKFGFLQRDGDDFVFENDDEPVRFFATNIGAAEAFPSKEEADYLAARMAKAGINLVRLHHLDNQWMYGQDEIGTIWDTSEGKHQDFNPEALDRLDYLIHAFKERGIYVNLNLKVSKELGEADGFPPEAEMGREHYRHQKRLDRFHPRMIELQKDFARKLLNHENAYTGLRYADDPAIAIVEINNENSIMHEWPGQPLGTGWDRTTDYFRDELTSQWNTWLQTRYANKAELIAAWGYGGGELG
ncbi:MAG: hypothetical protein AAGK78_16560, partial [Planctomycetota bacterium]